jgi:hypothetical protein
VPDGCDQREGQGEDLADRPDVLHRLRLLCRSARQSASLWTHSTRWPSRPGRRDQDDGGGADEERTGGGSGWGSSKEGISFTFLDNIPLIVIIRSQIIRSYN